MKKYLLNILAILLVFYGLYSLLAVFVGPLIFPSPAVFFAGENLAILAEFAIGALLYIATRIGLYHRKNWSIVLYWLILVFIPLISTFIPSFSTLNGLTPNDPLFLVLFVGIGILLLMQWSKMKENIATTV